MLFASTECFSPPLDAVRASFSQEAWNKETTGPYPPSFHIARASLLDPEPWDAELMITARYSTSYLLRAHRFRVRIVCRSLQRCARSKEKVELASH